MYVSYCDFKEFRKSLRSPFGRNSSTIMTCTRDKQAVNRSCPIISTHWLPQSDHSVQPHDVGVPELAIDGRLLQELELVFLPGLRSEGLDGNLSRAAHCSQPPPSAHHPKLPRAQRPTNSAVTTGNETVPQIISQVVTHTASKESVGFPRCIGIITVS